MKKIMKVYEASPAIHGALLIARIAVAVLMLTHGFPKMLHLFSGDPVQFASVFGLSAAASLALAVFAEVFCSLLIFMGLGTRLATVPLIITMLVAVLAIHAADPFAKQELGLLYLMTYVVLSLTGSGKYSLDYLLQQKLFSKAYSGKMVSA